MVSRPGSEAQTSQARILDKVQRWGMMTSANQVPRHDNKGEGGALAQRISGPQYHLMHQSAAPLLLSPLVYPHRLPIAPWQPFRAAQ